MSEHTPGPWVLREMAYGYDLTCQGVAGPGSYGGWFIELHSGALGDAEIEATFEADVRLIAAAPDMLAALKLVRSTTYQMHDESLRAVEGAIAKAEGGT